MGMTKYPGCRVNISDLDHNPLGIISRVEQTLISYLNDEKYTINEICSVIHEYAEHIKEFYESDDYDGLLNATMEYVTLTKKFNRSYSKSLNCSRN